MNNKDLSVVRDVNDIYKRQNPSQHVKNLTKRNINKIFYNKKKFLLDILKLPEQIFNNSDLLDLGCGSGQKSITYSLMGSRCTLVDFDKQSCNNTIKLFNKFAKKKFKVINKNIMKYKSKKKFDFVVSNGVVHHNNNPMKEIERASKFLKKGGFLILGIAETNGYFQRNLQRFILYSLSKNENEIVANSKILFKKHLDRAQKASGRTLDQIIYDTYLNPKVHCLTFLEIKKIFRKSNLIHYSSDENDFTPQVHSQFQTLGGKKNRDSNYSNNFMLNQILNFSGGKQTQIKFIKSKKKLKIIENVSNYQNFLSKKINNIKFKNFKNSFDQKMLKNLTIKISKINNLDLIDQNENIRFINEVNQIFTILKSNNKNKIRFLKIKKHISNCRNLFTGTNGKGMNYFVGYKY